jgi:DNA-binding MarR family transcriptional regulator
LAQGLIDLLRAAGFAESFVEARLSGVGLSLPKLTALHRLVEAGDALPLGQLADRLACVKSNVTQLVERLEADGLVSRAPDRGDRRSRLAVITASGRRAHEQGQKICREAERELFEVLSLDESKAFTEIINKLGRIRSRDLTPDL